MEKTTEEKKIVEGMRVRGRGMVKKTIVGPLPAQVRFSTKFQEFVGKVLKICDAETKAAIALVEVDGTRFATAIVSVEFLTPTRHPQNARF